MFIVVMLFCGIMFVVWLWVEFIKDHLATRRKVEVAREITQKTMITWDSVITGRPSPPPMPPVKPAKVVASLKPQHKWLFKP